MNQRNQRKQLAENTLKLIKQGYYEIDAKHIDIKHDVQTCISNTQLFTPEQLAQLETPATHFENCLIEVVNETTLAGAQRLYDSQQFKRIGVLNFASAKNAGGGFLGGSQAQEESLARSSALYPSLCQCPEYYEYHRKRSKTLLYSDHMIYSPQCPVIRLDKGELLAQPYAIDFITSPAPNYGALASNEPQSLDQLEAVFKQRMSYVFALAAHKNCDALVLGAWGCGVFRNEPLQVARLFAEHLQHTYKHIFKHISFSIPENPRIPENTEAFNYYFEQTL